MAAAVEVRVLGPVEVIAGSGPIRLAAMPRRLLAALATRAGEAYAADVLIAALWGPSPPSSARKLLQVYVSQLRKAMPSPAPIATRASGYALDVAQASLDAHRFERLLAEGRQALEGGNPALAASLLGRALALWRGEAYGELAYEEFARLEAERLEELRLVALERRLEAELALGRHLEALPALRRIAVAEPLRERAQWLFMLALYRSGRQTEALAHYADLRRHLRDELGLDPGSELRELQRLILRHDPTLAAADAGTAAAVLPASPSPLLGRARELDELRDLLVRERVRLLVLTGAGGSGKTRLALDAARAVAGTFANGSCFVELAPLTDPELIPAAIAQALGLPNAPDRLAMLIQAIQGQELLLVLDNAEHLRHGMTVVAELLARAPRLSLLVTSRAVLHLSGEHVYPVQPLPEEAAVALFYQRARETDPRFDAAGSEETVSRICARLDCLPLAIELAAARTRALAPVELLERLEPRLPLLTGGPGDLPARQRTLRATLEWSIGLLSPEEQALAARLAVFVGAFDLDGAVAICDADLDDLTALLEQSLLTRTTDGRFAYLETVRELALERLESSPEADEVHRRHFAFFLERAERANLTAVRRRSGEQRLDVAAAAQDNLRRALAWALESGRVDLGLQLATAMERFWVTQDPREGMRWFAALLERPEVVDVSPAVRAHALRAYGSAADIAGDDEAAERLYRQSLALFDQLGDASGRAVLQHRLGISALRRGALAEARELVEASHVHHEYTGNRWGQAQTLGALGAIARDGGERQQAFELIEVSAELASEAGVRWWEAGALAELAALSLDLQRVDDAERYAHDSLALAEQMRDRAGRVLGVGLFARIAAERGDRDRACLLWNAVRDEDAVAPLGGWRHHRPFCEARIRELVGDELDREPSTTTTLDDAVDLSLRPGQLRH